jgi:hypothetical protein
MVSREVVFGMDDVERKVTLFGVGIAMIVSIIYAIAWIKKSPVITKQAFVKGKACPSAFSTHVGSYCEHILRQTNSFWATHFLLVFVVGLIILFFALRRKRAGVACFACFLGVGLQLVGIVFLFLGVWLIVRAFRLQRYGEASWSGSNKAAREIAQAKKEGRAPKTKAKALAAPAPPPGPVAPPSASKRYTPKQKPRKR